MAVNLVALFGAAAVGAVAASAGGLRARAANQGNCGDCIGECSGPACCQHNGQCWNLQACTEGSCAGQIEDHGCPAGISGFNGRCWCPGGTSYCTMDGSAPAPSPTPPSPSPSVPDDPLAPTTAVTTTTGGASAPSPPPAQPDPLRPPGTPGCGACAGGCTSPDFCCLGPGDVCYELQACTAGSCAGQIEDFPCPDAVTSDIGRCFCPGSTAYCSVSGGAPAPSPSPSPAPTPTTAAPTSPPSPGPPGSWGEWTTWEGDGITYHGPAYDVEAYCPPGRPIGNACWQLDNDPNFQDDVLAPYCDRPWETIAFGHPAIQECGECTEVRVKRRDGGYNSITVMTTDVPGPGNNSPELSTAGKAHLDQDTGLQLNDRQPFDYRQVPCS